MKWEWIDLRACLLAVLLAVAAALPFMTTSVERRDFYFFDITLTSTTAGTTQFFWDFGNGFTEYNSSRQPIRVEATPVNYRFMMPMGRFTGLRFDPIDGVGEFTLTRAQITDHHGRAIKTFAPVDLLPVNGIRHVAGRGDLLEVYTDPASHDPVIHLRLSEPLLLESTPSIRWQVGWPVIWPVLLTGLLLGLPVVSRRLSAGAAKLAAWAGQRPVRSILLMGIITVAVQCHPVIFHGRSFASPNNGGHMLYDGLPALPGDTDSQSANTGSSDTGALLFQHLYYPMVQRDALLAGEWPLWNRYSLGGSPLLGQGQSMFGDPLNFLTIAADGAAWAWDVRFVIARWLLAVGLGGVVWQLTRHLGAALLTTLGAGFLGFFTYRLVHPANFSVCYSPLILLAWTGLQNAANPRRLTLWLAALIGANAMVLTSGTVKEAYMLMVGLNFAGLLLLLLREECRARRGFVGGAAVAAGLGFVLLTAPGWMTFLNAWAHAMTGYDTPQAQPLPWSQAIGFFDDIFYRQLAKDENVVAPALNFFLFAGFLAWLARPRCGNSVRSGLALLIAAIPPAALAFGLVPNAVVEKIPFVGNIVHTGNTFSCVLLTLVTVLAGLGFREAVSRLGKPGAASMLGGMWLGGGLLTAIYFLATQDADRSPFFTGYAAALLLTLWLLPLGIHWGVSRPRMPGPLWVVLCVGVPVLCWRHGQHLQSEFDRYTFIPGPRSDLHAVSPAVELVQRTQTAPGRVAGWESVLYASYNTVPRLEGVYGVDALRSRHYHEVAQALGLERVWNWDWPNRESEAADLVRKYDAFNVTHWLATPRASPPGLPGLVPLGREDLDVYASPSAWPRAYFSDRVQPAAGAGDFARLLLSGDGRPFATTSKMAPSGMDVPDSDLSAPDRVIVPARDYRFTPNSTTFTIDAPSAGVAVLLETYFIDDFQVRLNGQPVEYFPVNHTFRGVWLPAAGTYVVEHRYWPKHFTLSLWLGLAGAVSLGFGLAWLWRRPSLPGAGLSPT